MKPKLSFLGAAGTVTGSRYLLEYDGYRLLMDGADQLKFFGSYHRIRVEVEALDGLSAHADYAEMGDWLEQSDLHPKIYITHGEPAAADAFRRYPHHRFGWTATVAELGEVLEL